MRYRAIALMLCLLPAGVPTAALARAGGAAACPTTPAKLAEPPKLSIPPDAKITSNEIAFEVDVGSDGRVRALQMDASSGDGALDLSARQTLQAASYTPAQTGCIAYSSGLRFGVQLPVEGSPHPAKPIVLNTNCTPYVLAFLTPAGRDRKHTGTAVVAVELDAAGTRTAEPALRKSSGSAGLDGEALHVARSAQYNFLRGSSCAPQPFTYNLEVTFQ
jgi:TonB family protein